MQDIERALNAGATLHVNYSQCDHYVTVPLDMLTIGYDLEALDKELVDLGLERMAEEECETEFTEEGLRIFLAEIVGGM